MDLNLTSYLARIGYSGQLNADLATLAALQERHVNAIAFESLDPLLKRPVRLDLESLQAKLVDNRRGGYCFEQNILFRAALDAIGFKTTGLTGRVTWMSPPDAPLGPREHMLMRVDLPEGPHIVDVGFGACVMDAPLALKPDVEQSTKMGTFKVSESGGRYEMKAMQPAGWRAAYVFDLQPQIHADFELGNWYTSTSPGVVFANVLIIEKVGGGKRHKLINRNFLVEARNGEVKEHHELTSAEAFVATLSDHFGLDLPAPADEVFDRLG
jgi:N-hydroxyarylamine O-acetyltransferase